MEMEERDWMSMISETKREICWSTLPNSPGQSLSPRRWTAMNPELRMGELRMVEERWSKEDGNVSSLKRSRRMEASSREDV